ncbi:MAG TPA: serpin family protein [Gemmatimonadaceae bacterium]|nr:serpin family protein [Gemmatimonadaceae bacterium]
MRLPCRAFVTTLAAGMLVACSETTSPDARRIDALPRPLSAAEQKVVSAGNEFSFALFRQASAGEPAKNVFISPLSASMALGMTMNGAAGTTFDAMRGTLGFADASQEEINQGYRSLIDLLRGLDPATEFRIANSIWYRSGYAFEQPFFDATRTFFDAEVQGLNFGDPASLGTINAWVDRATNGKITSIIDVIAPDHVMFLINAIYFNGTWEHRFDRSQTRDAQFHAADGSLGSIQLMYRNGALRYTATPDYQAADLLYGNSAFAMTVLLPTPGTDINALVASLTEQKWTELTSAFSEHEMELYLPKFTLEYERRLNDDLDALGMGIAFAPGVADFTRMAAAGGLYIDYVKQKTFVDVHEDGTEAAAVTAVAIREASAPPAMRVDRPFIFAIRERFSGTILFIGKVVRLPPPSN